MSRRMKRFTGSASSLSSSASSAATSAAAASATSAASAAASDAHKELRTAGRTFSPGFGLPTLLVVFLSLCLAVLSVLALSTAKRSLRFSETAAARQTAWYSAVDAAEKKLASLDSMLEDAFDTAGYEVSDELLARTLALSLPSDCVYDIDDRVLRYAVPIDDRSSLSVAIRIDDTPTETHRYTVIEWRSVTTAEWMPEGDTLYLPEE